MTEADLTETPASPSPRTFISYSWTSPAHGQWVMDLATQLVESGVDVILDKWNLREGHDAVQFMESMVTDPNVTKVIVISDKTYAEKADARKGGVGTESQIISPEIYKKQIRTNLPPWYPKWTRTANLTCQDFSFPEFIST